MLKLTSLLVLLSIFQVANAQGEGNVLNPSELFSVTTGDCNADNADDAVLITNKNQEQFDVLFYVTDEHQRLQLHTYVPDMVWGSSVMFGQEPAVSVRQNGSLLLTSQNSAIGRHRWEQGVTIAFRDSKFKVLGFSYIHYDTLDNDAYGSCDLNLATGRGVVDDQKVSFSPNAHDVDQLNSHLDDLIEICMQFQN